MTSALSIAKGERGLIRLFALDMPKEQVKFLRDEAGALEQILGQSALDRAHVEIFAIDDLEELGITGYLTEGCGVPEENLAPHLDTLNALTGYVLLLRSRAFGGKAATLTPAEPVRFLAQVAETPTDWTPKPLEADSAAPYSALQSDTNNKSARFAWSSLILPCLIVIGALFYKLVIAK